MHLFFCPRCHPRRSVHVPTWFSRRLHNTDTVPPDHQARADHVTVCDVQVYMYIFLKTSEKNPNICNCQLCNDYWFTKILESCKMFEICICYVILDFKLNYIKNGLKLFTLVHGSMLNNPAFDDFHVHLWICPCYYGKKVRSTAKMDNCDC